MGRAARNHGGTGGHGCVPLPGERPNFNQHVLGDQVLLRLVNQEKQPEVAAKEIERKFPMPDKDMKAQTDINAREVKSKLPIPSKYLQKESITMPTKLDIQKKLNIKNPSVGHAGHNLFNEEKPVTSVNPTMQPIAGSVSIVQLPLSPEKDVIPTRKITVSSITTPECRVSSLSLNIVPEASSEKKVSPVEFKVPLIVMHHQIPLLI